MRWARTEKEEKFFCKEEENFTIFHPHEYNEREREREKKTLSQQTPSPGPSY
jgi:hypothetical protein